MAIVQYLQRSVTEKYLDTCEDWVKIWWHAPFLYQCALFSPGGLAAGTSKGKCFPSHEGYIISSMNHRRRPHTVLAFSASFLVIEALAPPLKHRNATSTRWQRSFYSGKQSNSSPDGGLGLWQHSSAGLAPPAEQSHFFQPEFFLTGWMWKLQQRGQLVPAKQKYTLAYANVLH